MANEKDKNNEINEIDEIRDAFDEKLSTEYSESLKDIHTDSDMRTRVLANVLKSVNSEVSDITAPSNNTDTIQNTENEETSNSNVIKFSDASSQTNDDETRSKNLRRLKFSHDLKVISATAACFALIVIGSMVINYKSANTNTSESASVTQPRYADEANSNNNKGANDGATSGISSLELGGYEQAADEAPALTTAATAASENEAAYGDNYEYSFPDEDMGEEAGATVNESVSEAKNETTADFYSLTGDANLDTGSDMQISTSPCYNPEESAKNTTAGEASEQKTEVTSKRNTESEVLTEINSIGESNAIIGYIYYDDNSIDDVRDAIEKFDENKGIDFIENQKEREKFSNSATKIGACIDAINYGASLEGLSEKKYYHASVLTDSYEFSIWTNVGVDISVMTDYINAAIEAHSTN
jgi:hypothetical protein